MLRVRTFGGLAAWVDGVAVPAVRGAKARSLMAHLAVHPGPHPRERLAGRFWPDVLDTSARGSLRSALWAVRAALDQAGGAGYLRADRAGVALGGTPAPEVDLHDFDRLLAAGDPASLRAAVAMADDPPLPELADEWVLELQERVRDRTIEALLGLADAAEGAGDAAEALAWTRRALARDRLRESSHRALMRRAAAAGDRAGALAAYRRCQELLAAELGLAPSPETRELAERIRNGDGDGPPPGLAATATARPPVRPPPVAPTPVARPALIGREAELAALGDAWAQATAGCGGLAVVAGAAGMGKSRLVGEVVDRAAAAGAHVAVGHATDIEDAPPFGAWAEALRGLVRACDAPPSQSRWPEELARLCPTVESAWGRHPGPAVAEPTLGRARLFEAVAEALDWCQRSAPTLMVIEDAHAGDPAGLALVAHAAARLSAARLLLVVTARTGPAADPVARLRAAAERNGSVRADIHLAPLAADQMLALVRAAAPGLADEPARRVAEAAGGTPLLGERAARAAAAGADPTKAVRSAVRVPLADLPGPARALVEALAVAGRGLTAAEAAGAAGGPEAEEAVDIAVASGLLHARGGRVAFAHDLLRRACQAELSETRRRAAHGAMARLLAGAAHAAPAELAHHLRGAGDEERARGHLRAAARAARALGALDQAAAFQREVARSAAASGDAGSEGEAWVALAEVEAWRGDREALDAAFARGRHALERAGDVGALAAALAERSRWLRTTACHPAEVSRSAREALELLDRAGLDAPETRLLAMAGMAWGESVVGDPASGERLQERLAGLLADHPDPVLACEVQLSRGFGLLRVGDTAGARRACAEAARLAEEGGVPALALDARIGQANTAAFDGDVEEVLRLLADAPDAARVGPTLACQALSGRAHALSRLGRHDEAVAAAREQVALALAFDRGEVAAAAEGDLGEVLLAAGRPAEAERALDRALAAEEDRLPRASTRLLAAEAALGAGALERATAHLDRFPFEPVRPGDHPATLIARLDRVCGLVRVAAGERGAGVALLDAAADRWRAIAGASGGAAGGSQGIVEVLIDLGRAPLAGLTRPAWELARLDRERAAAGAAQEVG